MTSTDAPSSRFRARHKVSGLNGTVRTESAGQGRRRALFSSDSFGGWNRVAWRDVEPIDEPQEEQGEPAGLRVEGDTAYIVEPATHKPKLGDIEDLIRSRGLDPKDWVTVSVTLNEWDGMTNWRATGQNEKMRLKQWKVTLRRAPHLILAAPAVHVPRVTRRPGPPASDKPDLIIVEGDHHAPYADPDLHVASLEMLSELSKRHRLAEHVFLGDTGDYPTISRHPDHPAAMASVNEVTQSTYDLLRDKREAAPQAAATKVKGNHDWRLEAELLTRAQHLYGIKPADTGPGKPELPALSLRRLLHLDALGIELVEHPLGWEHAEVELVPGPLGLVVRHGWLVGQKTAEKSLTKRGRSIIVGHKHSREHVYMWDAANEVERQAVVCAVMCLRNKRFGHYAPCNDWAQGCVVVTRWPDGAFEIEHVRWNGQHLTWRDRRWSA